MDREPQSARSTLEREGSANRIAELELQVARLQRTVVGLGSLVAEAHAAGFVQTASPEGNHASKV